jgi:hypothetical protein
MKAGSIIGRQGNCEPAPLAASCGRCLHPAIAELTKGHGVLMASGVWSAPGAAGNVFARGLLYPLKFQVWDEWTLG